jgi:hypothetical protein
MESERAKFLQEIVNQRFNYIAPEDARTAYDKGFPFGIGNMNWKPALDAKLAAEGGVKLADRG